MLFFALVGGLFCPAPAKGVNRIYPPTSRLPSALMMVMPLPIGHPDAIPAVCAAHISILRLSILQSGLCVTNAAFVHQAANVGQLMLCGIHSACPVLSGGGQMLGPQNCTTVAALSCAIWERKARTNPTLKSRDCTGPACFSRFFGAGSISLVLQGDMSKRLHLHEP